LESSLDVDPQQSSILLQIGYSIPWNLISVEVGILFFLVVCSALISGSEVAFFSLTGNDLKVCEESESSVSKLILNLLKKPKKLLATILIANNLVNVGAVTIGTYISWQLAGTTSQDNYVIVLTPVVLTILLVFMGEVLPKTYASQRCLFFAHFIAIPLDLANKLLSPISFILITLSRTIENRVQHKSYNFSVEEINKAIEVATSGDSESTAEEKEILKGIVNFGTKTARQVMHSRMDITAFSSKIDFHQLMDKINKWGYSRVPIYTDTIDNIIGILYVKDLLPFLENQENFAWQKLLRPAYFVPDTKKIDGLLESFQEKRVHMAICVDEYGGTSGLITLEDIIEEIVGEINDEFDETEIDYKRLDKNMFVFEGKTSLNDFTKIMNKSNDYFDEVKGESESLGGLLLELNSSFPNVGDEIKYKDFTFKIESANSKRIKKVRVILSEEVELDHEKHN